MKVMGNEGWKDVSASQGMPGANNYTHGTVSSLEPSGTTVSDNAFTLVLQDLFGLQKEEIVDFCGFKAFSVLEISSRELACS